MTITAVGPDRDVPVGRSFYVAGAVARETLAAQSVIVRTGSPRLLGADPTECATLARQLHFDATVRSAADDDEDPDNAEPDVPVLHAGRRHAYEVFEHADGPVRESMILVSAPWHRSPGAATPDGTYRIHVPADREFFSTGYAYCLYVVTSDHRQIVADPQVAASIDALAGKLVDCADQSACDADALDDYESKWAHQTSSTLATRLKEAARIELGAATGLVEARDRFDDKWRKSTSVMQPPVTQAVWLDVARDPFAFAVTSLLARAGELIPQVTPRGVSLFTTDGKLAVAVAQILDDNRTIRVASSKTPGDKARAIVTTTDTLPIADGLVLADLIELGHGRLRIEQGDEESYLPLDHIGQRIATIGLDEWTAEDSAFLASALVQLRRLELYTETVSAHASCPTTAIGSLESEHAPGATDRHLGEWLACRQIDVTALETLVELLDDLTHEEIAWSAARASLAHQSKRIVTVTTTSPLPAHAAFDADPWLFSYVTPSIGAAGILRTEESFGLFYVAAQIHLEPNSVDDPQWSRGITAKDLRRAFAIELGLGISTRDGYGPDRRFDGPGSFPAVFAGIAAHVLPYTSLSFGASLVDRKTSTLAAEEPHVVVSPYIGLTVQLNIPDLIRRAYR